MESILNAVVMQSMNNFLSFQSTDPGERSPLNVTSHPELETILDEILKLKSDLEAKIFWKESETGKGSDRSASPCCQKLPTCQPFPTCCNCQ